MRVSFVSRRDTSPGYHPHYTHQVRVSFVSSADSVVGTLDLTSYRKRGEREGGVSTKVREEVLTLTLTPTLTLTLTVTRSIHCRCSTR